MASHVKVKTAWKNLLKNRCPKCECLLHFDEATKRHVCALNDGKPGLLSCDFSCTEKTMAYVEKHGVKDIEIEDEDVFGNELGGRR